MTYRSTFPSWKTSLAAGLMAACCTAFSAHAQAPSSFQRSCRNIEVSGAVLSAVCRRMDGSWNRTAIQIDGIENIDGHLRVTGGGPSSYQRSCRDTGVNGDVLFANCRGMDGSWHQTELRIRGVANIDGVLRYER